MSYETFTIQIQFTLTLGLLSNVPVMFNTPNAFLELDPWQISRDLALQFKTTNKDGVIVFNGNEQRYLTLELREGQIVFSALKGNSHSKITRDGSK